MSNSNHSSTPGALPPSQQTAASTETWITAAEAASILHLTLHTVLNRAASGKLPVRIPEDMPFTYDSRQNYLIRLEGLPQKAQLEYLRRSPGRMSMK